IIATINNPHAMMQVPASVASDLLATLRTDAVLVEPQPQQLIVPDEGVSHLQSDSLFKVRLPFRQKRVGRGLDLDVPFDRHIRRLEQPDRASFPSAVRVCCLQNVVSVTGFGEILPVTPRKRLVWVAASHPMSQFTEDAIVHVVENLLAYRR